MDNQKKLIKIGKEKVSAYEIAQVIMDQHLIKVLNGILCIYKREHNYWDTLKTGNYDSKIRAIIPDCYKPECNHNMIREIIRWLDTLVAHIDLDRIPERNQYINFKNGCINVITHERKEKTPELYFRFYVNAKIPPEEGWPKEKIEKSVYVRYLNSTFSGKYTYLKDDFEEWMGLIFSSQRSLKMASIFYGKSNTGKTVALNMVANLLAHQFVSFVSFSQFSEEFAVANLAGKSLNISGEISGIKERRLDLFNSVVGNDYVMACFKCKDYFELKNDAFLAFACNELPMIPSEMVESFGARVVIFPFQNVIPRDKWIEDINAQLKEESDFICAMSIMGLARFINNGNMFSHQKKLDMIKTKALYRLNSFKAFSDENLIEEDKVFTSSQEIGNAYRSFCEEYDLDEYSSQIWSKNLRSLFPMVKKVTRKDKDGVQKRGYEGIRLRDKISTALPDKIFEGVKNEG